MMMMLITVCLGFHFVLYEEDILLLQKKYSQNGCLFLHSIYLYCCSIANFSFLYVFAFFYVCDAFWLF